MSKLADILKGDVLSEIDQVQAEADSKAEKLVSDAKARASEQIEARRRKIEAEFQSALRGMKSARELTVSIARIRARDQAIVRVREKVTADIEEIARTPEYVKILEALAEEAFMSAETAEAVTVHPGDQDKLRPWAGQKGLQLTADPALHLGVRIVTAGGLHSIENSLPERLQRGWETLVSGVAHRLWGEGSGEIG